MEYRKMNDLYGNMSSNNRSYQCLEIGHQLQKYTNVIIINVIMNLTKSLYEQFRNYKKKINKESEHVACLLLTTDCENTIDNEYWKQVNDFIAPE